MTACNEEIITNAEHYFQQLVDDIDQAQDTIDCESYILEDDVIGNRVIDSLCVASSRGVTVRLLVDGFGSSPWITSMLNRLRKQNGHVHIYHPMPWHFWQWGLAINREQFVKKFIYLFNVINRRNHRKTCSIDSNIYWIGSFNLSADHLPSDKGGDNWRDTAVRIETSCPEITSAFDRTWHPHRLSRTRLPANFPDCFRINDSRRKRRLLYRDLLSRITRSNERVWITTPYFIPEPRVLKRLKKAAQNGIDVIILLPGVSDVFFMPWASSWFYRELLLAGVKIYEYQNGVLHAKTLLIDNWATIGSSNMNTRSFMHDLEIDYVPQQSRSLNLLQQHFRDDLEQSKQVQLQNIQQRNPIIRLIGRIALYLRYWL